MMSDPCPSGRSRSFFGYAAAPWWLQTVLPGLTSVKCVHHSMILLKPCLVIDMAVFHWVHMALAGVPQHEGTWRGGGWPSC